jgi:hypothetical protein
VDEVEHFAYLRLRREVSLSPMIKHAIGMIPRDAGVRLRTQVENPLVRVPRKSLRPFDPLPEPTMRDDR